MNTNTASLTVTRHKPDNTPTWQLFLLMVVSVMIIYGVTQNFIMTNEAFISLYSDRLDVDTINQLYLIGLKYSIWGYLFIPLLLFLRIFLVTSLLQFSFVVRWKNIQFKTLFRIVLIAFSALLLGMMVKTTYLITIPAESLSIENMSYIPISIANFLKPSNYSSATFGFLSSLNLYELGWCLLIYFQFIEKGIADKIEAMVTIIMAWGLIAGFSWGLSAYLERIFG